MEDRTVTDYRTNPFIMVSKEVVNNDDLLDKPVDIAVYAVLCMYADNKTKEAHPNVSTIARKARSSDRVVRRSLRALEEAGYIKIKPRYDGRGHQASNQYMLTDRRK